MMELEAFEVSKMVRPPYLLLSWFFLGFHLDLGWRVANRKPFQYAISRVCVCVCARSNYVTAKRVIIVISDIAQSQTNKSKKQVAKKAELNNLLNHLSERRPWLPF